MQRGTGLLLLCMALAGPALAGPALAEDLAPPLIREISFEGNDTTREVVMLRELVIATGDPADPKLIERSRQAILDLGLFRSVIADVLPVEGGVNIHFVVKEKWYVLPYPRLSANSDGQNSYGAEVRWNNVWGLNHSLRVLVASSDKRDADRGRALSYIGSYGAPFLFGSKYGFGISGGRTVTPVTDPVPYDETVDEAEVLITRRLAHEGPASQGWILGSGLRWTRQSTSGADAPAAYGSATAFIAQLGYRDRRFKVYSEEGTLFGLRYEIADQHYGSDYSYSQIVGSYRYSMPIGSRAHQDLEFGVQVGSSNNGPAEVKEFQLGGTQGLRAYPRDFIEGGYFYLLSLEYLRPIYWDWLRAGVLLETGNVYDEADSMNDSFYGSLGLGLRVRFPRLVNFEFEVGYAFALEKGVGGRFYGNRVGR